MRDKLDAKAVIEMKKGVKYALIGVAVIIAAAVIWLIDPFTFPELSEDRIKNAPCAS